MKLGKWLIRDKTGRIVVVDEGSPEFAAQIEADFQKIVDAVNKQGDD